MMTPAQDCPVMETEPPVESVPTVETELDRVDQILELAQLKPDTFKPLVQAIQFDSTSQNDTLSLCEVGESLVELLKTGDSLIVRGQTSDHAVVVTDDRTYEMRQAETSNNLLLMPTCKLPEEIDEEAEREVLTVKICAMKQAYFELRPTRPQLDRVMELLDTNRYSGKECERDEHHQGAKFTFEDFQNEIQSSNRELLIQLKKLGACEIDGYWRGLDFDFEGQVLSHILDLRDEENWSFDDIPIESCVSTLRSLYERDIIVHVLKRYSEEDSLNDGKSVKLSEVLVCRYFAEMLLRTADIFNLENFKKLWQETVPEGMKTDLCLLEGIALTDTDSTPQTIKFFSCLELPGNVAKRFKALFEARPKWTTDEILPYIKDLATAKETEQVLLLKYARMSAKDGIKLYSTK